MADAAENQKQKQPKKSLIDSVDMIVGAVFLALIVATGMAMLAIDSDYLYGDVTNSEEVIRTSEHFLLFMINHLILMSLRPLGLLPEGIWQMFTKGWFSLIVILMCGQLWLFLGGWWMI